MNLVHWENCKIEFFKEIFAQVITVKIVIFLIFTYTLRVLQTISLGAHNV